MYFDIHKHFLGPDHVTRQATDEERKLQTSHYDSERKGWAWDKYIALHKEQHAIMESLIDYGYSGMDIGTKVHHFLQGIKSTDLETVVSVVWAQPEKYGIDFYTMVSYQGQMITKKGTSMQSIHISKARSCPVKPKVVAFIGKIECKKYPMAVWNTMTKEQQIQMRKLCK